MAQRDMLKVADGMKGKIPPLYQLDLMEIQELCKIARGGDLVKALAVAFDYGFALALRMVKREEQKARKAAAAGNQGV